MVDLECIELSGISMTGCWSPLSQADDTALGNSGYVIHTQHSWALPSSYISLSTPYSVTITSRLSKLKKTTSTDHGTLLDRLTIALALMRWSRFLGCSLSKRHEIPQACAAHREESEFI
ncbi:predicted protein [Lichtheimia corymbifera JMRC:FSU:9682]|uniref:Uncharacterized protein n=1 Tax=Lichtheimia corymbifera JMRC:FSU:9682 TaxID=1263082 RepID=A0A068RJ31_9FUNG|nr:predicted protein [Lichtheimia corymbifera JMRC:FSU:9682]